MVSKKNKATDLCSLNGPKTRWPPLHFHKEFGVLSGQRASLVHISAKMKPDIMLQSMGNGFQTIINDFFVLELDDVVLNDGAIYHIDNKRNKFIKGNFWLAHYLVS